MQQTIISMNGIEKSYGKHKVLNDINLTVNKGDIFGLVGKNGAGKTTLFKILLGLSDYQHGTICQCRLQNIQKYRLKNDC